MLVLWSPAAFLEEDLFERKQKNAIKSGKKQNKNREFPREPDANVVGAEKYYILKT